ncbi:cytochrome P450 [Streptomyces sp. CC224B]|uniref:cytochrome P450 n=1 Tax=Streptomyces sp. CC224B TaxID=3044571 RepID=UPI0024A891BC|nr:cytochrome P450 [Streptomyces sp. CC224B]
MTQLADRWGVDPAYFWMWDRRPDAPVEADTNGIVHVYGHAECAEVYGNPAVYSSRVEELWCGRAPTPEEEALAEGVLTETDPPLHTKLRKLVSRVFTPRMVAGLEPGIVKLAQELLDAAVGKEKLDLVEDFAYPLPMIVIADMLGVPHSDRALFKQWVDRMAAAAGAFPVEAGGAGQGGDDVAVALGRVPEMLAYLREQVAERRVKPREDLLTKLVEAEVDGERLSEAAVVNLARELLVAGHGTTALTLGNALLCLDAHPAQQARLRADPGLAPAVVEETLRFLGPIAHAPRAAIMDTELAGVAVPEGTMVKLWLGAANRDERRFDRPHVFDPDRDPNPHLAFGRGIHFCLGAPLARLESRIGLTMLLDRYPTLRTDPEDPPEFMAVDGVLGPSRLPLLTR